MNHSCYINERINKRKSMNFPKILKSINEKQIAIEVILIILILEKLETRI